MGYVSTGMADCQRSRPAMGCDRLAISQTSINSNAVLVSLMAVKLVHVDRKTFWPCFSRTVSLATAHA